MKKFIFKYAAAVLAAITVLAAMPVSAQPTNTDGDCIMRIDGELGAIGLSLYKRLSEEAAKPDGGFLRDPAKAENLTSVLNGTAYGCTVITFSGKTAYDNAATDQAAAASAAVNAAIKADVDAVMEEIPHAYAAFFYDHPECFWLSGESNFRYKVSYTYTSLGTAEYTVKVFLVLHHTDDAGNVIYDLRAEAYRDTEKISEDIAVREAAIAAILSGDAVRNASSSKELVRALSDAITKRNCYYSGSAASAPDSAHTCLTALVGGTGTNGPVCEGYANAFKVLCDRAGIPCVSVFGSASSSAVSKKSHMWNAVMLDGRWYAVDVTWNDPTVSRVSSAISGAECHDYTLVGADTVVDGKRFADSHIQKEQLTDTGTIKAPAPVLSPTAYTVPNVLEYPFTDVPDTHIYYGGTEYTTDNGIMNGVPGDLFLPDGTLTRAMVVTILYRFGSHTTDSEVTGFTDVPAGQWHSEAVTWAHENGIVLGYGDGRFGPTDPVTREQVFAILIRYTAYAGYSIPGKPVLSLSGYTYSPWAESEVTFARSHGLTDLNFDLTANASRAETAEIIERLAEIIEG